MQHGIQNLSVFTIPNDVIEGKIFENIKEFWSCGDCSILQNSKLSKTVYTLWMSAVKFNIEALKVKIFETMTEPWLTVETVARVVIFVLENQKIIKNGIQYAKSYNKLKKFVRL